MPPEQKQEWSAAEQIRQQEDAWTCLSNPGIQQLAVLMVGLPGTGDRDMFMLQAGGAELNQKLGIFIKATQRIWGPPNPTGLNKNWIQFGMGCEEKNNLENKAGWRLYGNVVQVWCQGFEADGTLGGVSFWCYAALLCKSRWWILHCWVMLSYVTVALFILKSFCGGGNLRASNISTLWHFLCPHSFVWSFTRAGPTRRGQGGTRVVSRGSEWKHVFSRKNK